MPEMREPDWTEYVRARLRLPALPGRREDRMIAELADHLRDIYHDALSRGSTAEQAMAEAERRLSDADVAAAELVGSEPSPIGVALNSHVDRADTILRSRGGRWTVLANLLHDLRDSVRSLKRRPGFTAIAVVSLAIGIGANTAVFTLVNVLMLRGLPYERPEELVDVHLELPTFSFSVLSYPDFEDVRDRTSGTFLGMVASQFARAKVDDEADVLGEVVTGNYFSLLGVRALLGRTLGPDDDRIRGGHPVVMLSHGYWQRHFSADPAVLGRELRIAGYTYTIVGVVAPDYRGIMRGVLQPAFYAPMAMLDELMPGTGLLDARDNHNMIVKARLVPDVTLAQADAAVKRVAASLGETRPLGWDPAGTFDLVRTTDVLISPQFDGGIRRAAWLLTSVVGLVLLLACVNLAGFLLARSLDRRRDVAIRLALGASRGRLVRQLLTESTLLALLGGGAGLALSIVLLRLAANVNLNVPVSFDLSPDRNVFAFTFAVSLIAGVVLGLVPALQSTRADVAPTLKNEAAAGRLSGRLRWRNALVVAQLTVSLLLLVGAGLFLRSLQRQYAVDPGFSRAGAAVLTVNAPLKSTPQQWLDLSQRLRDRFLALPGVEVVGMANRLPVQAAGVQWIDFTVAGQTPPPGQESFRADRAIVDPGFFDAVGIPLLQGRAFTDADRSGGEPVVIISSAMARRFWPAGDAVDHSLHLVGGSPRLPGTATGDFRVVGVAADVNWQALGEPPAQLAYVPSAQYFSPWISFVARTSASEEALVGMLAAAAREIDPDLQVRGAQTMAQHLAAGLRTSQIMAVLLAAFAALTLALATIGLYGVVNYVVAARTREVGIRIALGATAMAVLRLLVASGARLVLVGGVLGLVLAVPASRLLGSLLFGGTTFDLWAFAGAALVLGATTLLAAFVPARRASHVDPVTALRTE